MNLCNFVKIGEEKKGESIRENWSAAVKSSPASCDLSVKSSARTANENDDLLP